MLNGALKPELEEFGVKLTRFDCSRITPDTDSENWYKLQKDTAEFSVRSVELNQEIALDTAQAQADVLKTAAQNLGTMGTMPGVGGAGNGNGGMNIHGLMTGVAVGGAMGQQIANMMGQMGQKPQQQTFGQQQGMPQMTPPPLPGQQAPVEYMIVFNGQQAGPFSTIQLMSLRQQGQLTPETLVWKAGMANWALAYIGKIKC